MAISRKSDLIDFLRNESPRQFNRLVALSVVVGIVNTIIIGIINNASRDVVAGVSITGNFFIFSIFLIGFLIITKKSNEENIRSTQEMIHKFKLRIIRDVYNTDLEQLDKVGRDHVAEVMIRDTQLVSQNLVVVVTSCQAIATLLFLTLYMLTVSLAAFVIVLIAVILIMLVSVVEVGKVTDRLGAVIQSEASVNALYADFLNGFKELKMNSMRAYDLTSEIIADSQIVNEEKTMLITVITNFFNMLQIFLYVVVGIIIFIVPIFSEEFVSQVPTAATTALFLAASLNGLITSIPGLSQADIAAKSLKNLAECLESSSVANINSRCEDYPQEARFIEMQNVVYTHDSKKNNKSFTVGPVNYRFDSGNVYFIKGNNGSGKTTLIRVLLGLYQPTSGQIVVDGIDRFTSRSEIYRNYFSVVFTDFHLFKKLYGIKDPDPEEIDYLIRVFKMEDKVSVTFNEFSSLSFSTGQRKRLALMVSLLEKRPIIVLDEWAADQDPFFRKEFYEVLVPTLKLHGKTIIAITHDDSYYDVADYLIEMVNGQILIS